MSKYISLLLFIGLAWGQNSPIDFETGGYGATWTWTVFENGDNPSLEIVTNPNTGGINSSATVAKFTGIKNSFFGTVVQLVRTPACQAGGREFESRRSRSL